MSCSKFDGNKGTSVGIVDAFFLDCLQPRTCPAKTIVATEGTTEELQKDHAVVEEDEAAERDLGQEVQ